MRSGKTGLGLDSALIVGLGLGFPSLPHQAVAEPVERLGVFGFAVERGSKVFLGLAQLVGLHEDIAQVVAGMRVLGFDADRLLTRIFNLMFDIPTFQRP